MRLEWITVCREVRQDPPTVDVFGINQGAAFLYADLPVEVTVTMAACLLAELDEVRSGAIVTLRADAFREDGSHAGWREERFLAEEGDPLPPNFERRVIYDFQIVFGAISEGVYRIVVALEGQQPLSVTYLVRRFPTL